MVVADVDGTEIPIFVDEEIYYVEGVESCGYNDGFGDEAVELVLVGDEG